MTRGREPGRRGPGRGARIASAILAALLALVAYTVWDNGRIALSEVSISHPDLPAAFDGYRIVQVTDLHGARFGEGQADLLSAIREARPDVVLLTGDYVAEPDDPSEEDMAPIAELISGLPAGTPVYYVLGNWDTGVSKYGAAAETDTPLVAVLESRGAKPVYPYQQVVRGADRIWLTDWVQREFKDERDMREAVESRVKWGGRSPARMSALYGAAWERQKSGHDAAREFDLAVTHAPLAFADYDLELARNAREAAEARAAGTEGGVLSEVDWDVSIAGHTQGGQFRLPLVGALVAPDRGVLPGTRFIEGTYTDRAGRVTYVSRGLGAGGDVPWLRFRLFNTPELSVITLRRGPVTR